MTKMINRNFLLNDGTILNHYYAKDDHGSQCENFTHKDENGETIEFYHRRLPIVMELFSQVKELIK